MRNSFVETMIDCAGKDEDIVLLIAEVGFSVVEPFENMYPNRFYNVGIAEQDLVLIAAGMALRGFHPVVYSMSSFLASRAFEQIKISVCYQNLPVVLVSIGSGLSYGEMGATHHAIEESAILRSLPNIKVLYPANKMELKKLLCMALKDNMPYFISFPKAQTQVCEEYDVEVGKAVKHRTGDEGAILAFGYSVNAAVRLADQLREKNKKISVYGFHTIKPLDRDAIIDAASTGKIYVIDEHNYAAGVAAEVARILMEERIGVELFKEISIPDCFEVEVRDYKELLEKYGFDLKDLID